MVILTKNKYLSNKNSQILTKIKHWTTKISKNIKLNKNIDEKVRKSENVRNFKQAQNNEISGFYKFLPPPAIKGAFIEGGGLEEDYLLVGFDTEFHFDENNKVDFLTYQFYIENFDIGYFVVRQDGDKLSFKDVLLFLYKNFKFKKIIFVAHFGVVDYLKFSDYRLIFERCRINMKTIFGNFNYVVYDENRNKKEFQIIIKDTMLLAGGGSLKKLGNSIGIDKIDIGRNIERMKQFYKENFDKFLEYAMNDSIIAVKFFKYFNKVLKETLSFGVEDRLKVNTASSVGEVFFLKIVEGGRMDIKDFNGRSVIKNIYWNEKLKRMVTYTKEGFDDDLKKWQKGYYGGRNETYLTGLYQNAFYDYDVKNAYPLAMLSIQDVDWSNRIDITNNDVYKLKFNDLGFLYLSYEFNEDVKYPLFPQKTDYGLVFTRKGKTIVSIPEFLTALNNNMLKSFYIRDGIKFKKKKSLTIPKFIKLVIEERAKNPKGTYENEVWKLVANSFYGKTAQGLTNKKSLNLKKTIIKGEREYKEIGFSLITNHFIAGYITGVIRSIVGEYMHYFSKNDIKVINVTTDGFMIDNKLFSNELKGVGFITNQFTDIRKDWLGDENILELKHFSDEKARNVVIKTRGYWLEPVKKEDVILIARAGIQTKKIEKDLKDDFEKKKAVYDYLTKNYLNADYNLKYIQKNLYNIGDVLTGNVEDIYQFEREVSMNFDYDFKRKPVKYSDQNIIYCNKKYIKLKIEETEPFDTIEEFLQFKKSYEKFNKHKTNVNKIQKVEDLEKFLDYVKLQKYADTQVHKLEQVVLTKIIYVLLLNKYSNKEISNILNIDVKKVEKRKYSKTFKKVLDKGIKKITEKEYNEVFKTYIEENIKDREIKILIKNELVINDNNDEEDYFEVLANIKNIKGF